MPRLGARATESPGDVQALSDQGVQSVADWLEHRDLGTTIVYTDQKALDLVRATNSAVLDLLANDRGLPG